jgi:hypothetical protein
VQSTAVLEDQNLRSKLPRPALEKLAKLFEAEEAKNAAYTAVFQRQDHARTRWRQARAKLDELRRKHPSDPVFGGKDFGLSRYRVPMSVEERREAAEAERNKILAGAETEAETAEAELNRIAEQCDAIRSKTSGLPSRVLAWCRALPLGTHAAMHPKKISVPSGDLQKAVAGLREKLADLEIEKQATETAPLPSSMAREIMRAEVARLAEAGRPDCLRVTELGMAPRFATSRLMNAAGLPELQQYFDGVSLIAFLFKDELVAALDREITEISDGDENALSPEARKKRLHELSLDALDISRIEERCIELAAEQNFEIARRPNAHPAAVLGLSDDLVNHL